MWTDLIEIVVLLLAPGQGGVKNCGLQVRQAVVAVDELKRQILQP